MSRFCLVPVPLDDGMWDCLRCRVDLDRRVRASVLLESVGEPGEPQTTAGLCGNHAEVLDLKELEESLNDLH